jgi:putative solute:sodium symporter small subunit
MDQDQLRKYWRANINLIRNLLIVWAIVSIGLSILLVMPLNNINLGQLPLGFWMAQQGSIFVFVALIFIYAIQMDKIDRKYK